MPGEISRPHQPPDTPEWREAHKALEEFIDRLNTQREQERRERQNQEHDQDQLRW